MEAIISPDRPRLESLADSTLKAVARFWFVVTVIGQWIFAFYIAAFYGGSAVHGDLAAWSKVLPQGYLTGDDMGNFALAGHLLLAAIITVGGPLQIIPHIRARFPTFHRWNGRLYMLTAFLMSVTGLYLIWARGYPLGDFPQHLAISLNAIAILACAAMALRHALARDFKAHRRWALRLFLVVSGVWFFRVGLMLSFLIFQGPFGFDPKTFVGPFLTLLTFAQFVFPLAVLELYLRTQDRAGAAGRFAMAAVLFLLTLAVGAGISMATVGMWLPQI